MASKVDKRFVFRPVAIPWGRMIPYRLLVVTHLVEPQHMAGRYLAVLSGTGDAQYTTTLFMGLS